MSTWRPISLINRDIKIISKVLATRLKKAIPHIIHIDQKGCIENRYIGHYIRLVQDVINEQHEDRLILLLDQQKAFDRVEWIFLMLEKFNFGKRFMKWIQTMYSGMKSAILTNRYLYPYFSISRGYTGTVCNETFLSCFNHSILSCGIFCCFV